MKGGSEAESWHERQRFKARRIEVEGKMSGLVWARK